MEFDSHEWLWVDNSRANLGRLTVIIPLRHVLKKLLASNASRTYVSLPSKIISKLKIHYYSEFHKDIHPQSITYTLLAFYKFFLSSYKFLKSLK